MEYINVTDTEVDGIYKMIELEDVPENISDSMFEDPNLTVSYICKCINIIKAGSRYEGVILKQDVYDYIIISQESKDDWPHDRFQITQGICDERFRFIKLD